ncbi:hypothetical protein HPP92_012866 [Vanilla planifolia]|uniref:Uncharacterized protein n=1 Tax=Vanilla planifolia TaxID=51239 RepID=A0A835QTG4_VANPL|nr:hypothetical protein HPP92_012866 [Vanilla planifolia]
MAPRGLLLNSSKTADLGYSAESFEKDTVRIVLTYRTQRPPYGTSLDIEKKGCSVEDLPWRWTASFVRPGLYPLRDSRGMLISSRSTQMAALGILAEGGTLRTESILLIQKKTWLVDE